MTWWRRSTCCFRRYQRSSGFSSRAPFASARRTTTLSELGRSWGTRPCSFTNLRNYHRLHLTECPHRLQCVIDLIEPVAIGKHILKGEALTVVLDVLQGLVVVLRFTRHDGQDR